MANQLSEKPIWSLGFRPFFLMVLVSAILPSTIWVLHFTGLQPFTFEPLTPNQWHANEMIFGFVMAAIFGFLLTASANWTATRGVHGKSLIGLFCLFLLTRLMFWLTPFEQVELYIPIGVLPPMLLVIHLARLFIRTNNKRNLILLAPLSVLIAGQALILSRHYQLGYELSLYSVRFLIIVIAGRIIPFFTSRAIGMEPKRSNVLLERLTILSAFVLIFEPLYMNAGDTGKYFWLVATLMALALNTYRLVNWRFFPSFKVKILFVLYVAYAWLPVHFGLNLATHFYWVSDLGRAALHALSYGCVGTMIIGIIHRVTLGHTGRMIKASPIAVCGYLLMAVGTIVRVFAPALAPANYLLWIQISGALWVLAFVAVGIEIAPMLVSPRADGKEF